MKRMIRFPYALVLMLVLGAALTAAPAAMADENIALYGLKGYAYTFSPQPVKGFYIQSGLMYANYSDSDASEGDIWTVPVSLTYGDGRWWEVGVAGHFESWDNNDLDMSESGPGDLFLAGKFRLLGTDDRVPMDLALMPYITLPTGDRDNFIGDLYGFNPTNEDELTFGLNLLLGREWRRFYLAANVGVNYMDSDADYVESSSLFLGLTLQYFISETLTAYAEFYNMESKIDIDCDPCVTQATDDDLRELGGGILWLWRKWGFKAHLGTGFTDVSPSIRLIGLVNRNF